MSLRKMNRNTLLFSALLFIVAPLRPAEAQDVDVPGNLTMHDSADPTVGNILKEGVPFLHNFGNSNTFLGSGAGNFTMSGSYNTSNGLGALRSNTMGSENTANGAGALASNTTGHENTASGSQALYNSTANANTASGFSALYGNTTGNGNTASGHFALDQNTTGNFNTALGSFANVSVGDLSNATAIGFGAVVNASNKIRLGNGAVTVVEGPPYSVVSDRNEKENFRAVDPDEVLNKLRRLAVTSWNYKGQDAKQFRHYGAVAQDFFAAFGHDSVGTVGSATTITSGDLDGILMIAAQALEKRTVEQRKEIDSLRAENAILKNRLKALERRVGSEVATSAKAGL